MREDDHPESHIETVPTNAVVTFAERIPGPQQAGRQPELNNP